jgi:cation diffusion facilitator CzcD-associated flavoprotein CzcO
MEHSSEKPTVLIVGAGLGGLMLGVLLEKQGVPYTIFERASSVKPLGKANSRYTQ